MIRKGKSDFSFRISWHLYAHKYSNQFVSYIQLKLLFLSIETTVARPYAKSATQQLLSAKVAKFPLSAEGTPTRSTPNLNWPLW